MLELLENKAKINDLLNADPLNNIFELYHKSNTSLYVEKNNSIYVKKIFITEIDDIIYIQLYAQPLNLMLSKLIKLHNKLTAVIVFDKSINPEHIQIDGYTSTSLEEVTHFVIPIKKIAHRIHSQRFPSKLLFKILTEKDYNIARIFLQKHYDMNRSYNKNNFFLAPSYGAFIGTRLIGIIKVQAILPDNAIAVFGDTLIHPEFRKTNVFYFLNKFAMQNIGPKIDLISFSTYLSNNDMARFNEKFRVNKHKVYFQKTFTCIQN